MITIEALRAAKAEHERTTRALENLARSIASLRDAAELHPEFVLAGYSVGSITAELEEEEGLGYESGLAVVTVHLSHHRWTDSRQVTVPASYLDGTDGYLAVEKLAIVDRARNKADAEERDRLQEERDQAASRRATYERLRAEFET